MSATFNHNNIWYPGATNIIEYNHPEQQDTDIVKCCNNDWLNIINQERVRLQRLIDQSYGNHCTVSILEAQESILRHCPHLNVPVLDRICNRPFIKCHAKDSNVTPVNIFGLIYKCSSCFSGFDEDYTIFMCPIHSHYILCSLCHGYHAEMQIYKILKNRIISMDPKCPRDLQCIQLTQLALKQDLESLEISAIDNVNKICQSFINNDSITMDFDSGSDDEIAKIIIKFIDKRELIKILPFHTLISLLNSCWNSQIIKTTPKLNDKYYSVYPGYKCGFNAYSTTFRLHKLSMTPREFNKLQNKSMYKKYIKHNTVTVNWNEVKTSNWIWRFFIDRNKSITSHSNSSSSASSASSSGSISNSSINSSTTLTTKSKLNIGAIEFVPQTEQRRRRKESKPSKASPSSAKKSVCKDQNLKKEKEKNTTIESTDDSSGSSARLDQSSPELEAKPGEREQTDKDNDSGKISDRLFIGDILETLCSNDRYKFDGIEMKLRDYSYATHQYSPGGKPKVCGDGNCLIFRIGDNMDYYVISQYERKKIDSNQ